MSRLIKFKVTKKAVLKALDELVSGYKDSSLEHKTYNCPLCLTYDMQCNFCPNKAFSVDNIGGFCGDRCNKYPKLSYQAYDGNSLVSHKNDADLAKFWQEVRDLYQTKGVSVINELPESLQSEISLIAEKYK